MQIRNAALVLTRPKQPLEFRTISLNGDKGGMLAVVDGQPRLVNSRTAWTEWTLRETDKGWTIQGRYPEKNPNLDFWRRCEREGHAGCEIGRRGLLETDPQGHGHSFDATIQVSGGKFDGWYLGFSDKQEQIERGNQVQVLPPVMSEKPGPRTNLYIFIDGP